MLSMTERPPIRRAEEQSNIARCVHCGGAARNAHMVGEDVFCCAGCAAAFALAAGLKSELASPTENAQSRYADLDDPAFQSVHVRSAGGGLSRIDLYLPNVHCATCVNLLERLPAALPGVAEIRIDLPRKTTAIRWDQERLPLSAVAAALDGLGYPPHPVHEDSRVAAAKKEERRQLANLAVAGACAGNAMLIALASYLGAFSDLAAEHQRLFDWAATTLGLVAILGPGRVFFRGAWAALKSGSPHMDLPVALGLGIGGIAGFANTLLDRGGNYFDSLAMLVFLLLVGRHLQFRQQRLAADSVSLLRGLMPRSARLVEGGVIRTIPLEALKDGMVVEVRPGESFPADGVILEGSTSVDQSLLTGESEPIPASVGDSVLGGTGNLGGVVRMNVSSVGGDTRVGALLRLAEDSATKKPPIIEFADRMAGRFVVLVMTVAAGSLLWWWSAGAGRAIDIAVALLIVSCPCALGLATPLALAVAQGQAARRGILIQSGDVFERLSKPGRLWLDKTGTITVGKHTLDFWVGDDAARSFAAALERRSSHPLGKSLAAALATPDLPVRDFQQHQRGVEGSVGARQWLAGSWKFLCEHGIVEFPTELKHANQDALSRGLTPIWIATEGKPVAVAAMGDRIRDDSKSAVEALTHMGWEVGLLSGDQPAVTARVAAAVGIPADRAFGGQTPEDKLQRVTQDSVPNVMVGDGVNDAAALAAAGVGVAVHGGAETCLRAAPVYLSRPGLGPLVELMNGSRRTIRTVRINYAASLAYNLSFIALAAAGQVTPLVAAVLMPISSLTVVGIALASRMFPEEP
jgi:Cu2+-exporting ATPase